ncbi:MAG: glutamine synthetase [Chloroflexi bacterium]|nr:glutamine synthetase [Chloroflexota bacterium]
MSGNGVLERARAAGVDLVHLQFTAVPGTIKSLTIPATRLEHVLDDGAWFDGSSIEGMARVAESDLFLRPDPSTFALLPWERTPTARMICDLSRPDGSPFLGDPRTALKLVLAEATELGFEYRVSSEVEFFLFEANRKDGALAPVDSSGYFEVTGDRAGDLCRATTEALAAFGVEIEATHHEVAPGQYELDVADAGALQAADAIVALKWAARALGRRAHVLVSFMPKPLTAVSGSGLHLSQALHDADGSAFYAADRRYQLSTLGEQFIAGQLAHARGMSAVLAPLVNSYKRLNGGAEAPARVCWARTHRGALIRVPEPSSRGCTRIELRAPDPSCNPYLALAVMLKTGLDGIANALPLPEPVEEVDRASDDSEALSRVIGPLPTTLGESLEEFDWDPVVREALGQLIHERFLAAKEQEWLAYQHHISGWEVERYLESA